MTKTIDTLAEELVKGWMKSLSSGSDLGPKMEKAARAEAEALDVWPEVFELAKKKMRGEA